MPRGAAKIGLVDRVVAVDDLDAAVDLVLADVRLGAPGAQARAKALVRDVVQASSRDEAAAVARQAITDARASDEGRAGTAAFLERRDPPWRT